jgi:hypothetical protein
MPKLKLEIDALRVESFDTSATAVGAGTVRAHADAVGVEEEYAITTPQTQRLSCIGSCQISCLGTCLLSCGGTCDDLCSLGCSDGCTVATCLSGAPVCCA